MFGEYKNLFFVYSIGLSFILTISFFSYFIISKYSLILNKKKTKFIFFFSLSFYLISILYLTLAKINSLHHYVDFATHLEILWRNNTGLGLTTLMSEEYHKGSHWFAAHFTPIIYLTYVPAFKIFPSTITIPIFETIFICSSLLPLWLISKKYFNENLSRLFISSFLFFPTVFYTNLYGIAYIELCIPIFLWLIYFFEQKNNIIFIFFLFLFLMIREEVALVSIFFGIYIIIKKRYFLGSITIFLSITYFYAVISFVMPFFRDGYETHLASILYQHLGNSNYEIFANILFNPLDTINKVINLPRMGNFIMLLIPLMFTPLLELPFFLIALPNLAMTFLSQSITHSSFILYYLSPSIPIFFYSAILGISKFSNYKIININAMVNTVLVASISTTIFFGATPISIAFWKQNYSVGNFYTTNFHFSSYVESERDKVAKKIARLVPDNAIISAEQHLLPLLYKKKKMVIFPSPDEDIQYVFIDRYNLKKTGGPTQNVLRTNPEAEYQKYLNSSDWVIIEEEKGVILLKKIN